MTRRRPSAGAVEKGLRCRGPGRRRRASARPAGARARAQGRAFRARVPHSAEQGSRRRPPNPINVKGKHVLVIGGGDTGSDCVGTSNRHGAASITQIELLPRPPEQENGELTWPYWPLKMRTSSSHDEGCARDWAIGTKEFIGENGVLKAVKAVRLEWKDGRMSEVAGSEFEIRADYVFLAMGFVSPVGGVLDASASTRTIVAMPAPTPKAAILRHQRGWRVCCRRHAPRPVAGGLGDPRRPPVRAQRRPVSDGCAPPCRGERP
jgi:hypothetical protein